MLGRFGKEVRVFLSHLWIIPDAAGQLTPRTSNFVTRRQSDKVVQDIGKNLRTTRTTIVVVDWVATIAVLLLIRHGASISQFCCDCKK
jgi:hypothetical protein